MTGKLEGRTAIVAEGGVTAHKRTAALRARLARRPALARMNLS